MIYALSCCPIWVMLSCLFMHISYSAFSLLLFRQLVLFVWFVMLLLVNPFCLGCPSPHRVFSRPLLYISYFSPYPLRSISSQSGGRCASIASILPPQQHPGAQSDGGDREAHPAGQPELPQYRQLRQRLHLWHWQRGRRRRRGGRQREHCCRYASCHHLLSAPQRQLHRLIHLAALRRGDPPRRKRRLWFRHRLFGVTARSRHHLW